jgi:Immunity protein 21
VLHRTETLTWIESNGGPLLLISREFLSLWQGIGENWFTEDAVEADYDRACAVDDYAGLIDVGLGQGLVLGGEPLATTWFHPHVGDHRTQLLVRWMYADDEAQIRSSLETIPEDIWEPVPGAFAIGAHLLYLFDSAFSGSEVGTAACPCLITELPNGLYTVFTGVFQPDDDTSLVLHRFVPG